MRQVIVEGCVHGRGPDLPGVGREGFMEKMVTGRSLGALDPKLFMFPILTFPK